MADLEIFGKLLVVLLSIGGLWLLVPMSALDPSVDDHYCRSKTRLKLSLYVFLVRLSKNCSELFQIFSLYRILPSRFRQSHEACLVLVVAGMCKTCWSKES